MRNKEIVAPAPIVELHVAPLPLLRDVKRGEPFPMASLPPLMHNAAEAIAEHVKAPPVLAAHCVIGAAAHVAQSRINVPKLDGGPTGMPCSLFVLTLGDSGDRKSACQRLAYRIVDEAEANARTQWQQQCREISAQAKAAGKSVGGKEIDATNLPRDPRTIYGSDASFSKIVSNFIAGDSFASWSTDEGGQFFGGHSMVSDTRIATLGGLVKLFDDGRVERDRATANLDGSGFAYHRRLSVLLLAQEIAVRQALNDPLLQGQGFLPRFLFASSESLAGTRLLTADDLKRSAYADARLQGLWQRFTDIINGHPVPTDEGGALALSPLPMSEDAGAEWLSFYNDVEREQAPLGRYSVIKPFAGRSGELARRLAGVFAFFDGAHEIGGEAMRGAVAVVRHSLSEWLRYTESAKASPEMLDAQHLLMWLQEPKRADRWQRFHRDQLGKSGPNLIRESARRRDVALSILVKHRYLQTTDDRTYSVNPQPPVAESAEDAELQARSSFADAEDLRKVAEVASTSRDARGSSASLRKSSASSKADCSDVSADSAQSASAGYAEASEAWRPCSAGAERLL